MSILRSLSQENWNFRLANSRKYPQVATTNTAPLSPESGCGVSLRIPTEDRCLMSLTDHNKALASEFINAIANADFDKIADFYTDDARIFTMSRTLISGEFTAQQVKEHARKILDIFPDGLRFEIHQLIADGDRVVVEAESFGRNAAGAPYNNQYMFLMRFRGDKLCEFKEYFDSEMVTEVMCGGQQAQKKLEPSGRIVRA